MPWIHWNIIGKYEYQLKILFKTYTIDCIDKKNKIKVGFLNTFKYPLFSVDYISFFHLIWGGGDKITFWFIEGHSAIPCFPPIEATGFIFKHQEFFLVVNYRFVVYWYIKNRCKCYVLCATWRYWLRGLKFCW